MAERRCVETERWHVGKEIPLAIMLAILLQTGGVIWWASALNEKLDSLRETVNELKAERVSQTAALKDIALLQQSIVELSRRVTDIEIVRLNSSKVR